jgi:hypothetical protein
MATANDDRQTADTAWKAAGERIVARLSERDFQGLAESFHPQVRCRLLIPDGLRTTLGPEGLAEELRQWFGDADRFDIEGSEITQVGDCLHVSYDIRLREGGRWYILEQQTFSHLHPQDGTITRFDLLCSGFRPDCTAA